MNSWRFEPTIGQDWGEAFLRVKRQGLPVRPWIKKFMTCQEMEHYFDNYDMQGRGPAYLSTLWPGVRGKSPEYGDAVIDWAGFVYCYWVMEYLREPA